MQNPSDHAGNHNCDNVELPSGDHAGTHTCNHAAHLISDQAKHPIRDHAKHLTGDQADQHIRDHSMHPTCDQVGHPTCDHAEHPTSSSAGYPACDHAMYPANDHAGHPPRNHAAHTKSAPAVPSPHPVQPQDPNTTSSTPTAYINLQPVACSAVFLAQQQSRGEYANIYTAHSSLTTHLDPNNSPPDIPPQTSTDDGSLLSYALPAMASTTTPDPTSQDQSNNKTDILTQSQMFKALDKDKFLGCQADEINSLYPLDIMDAYPTSTLPPKAKLLSSIWSYRRKRLPNGVLSKYKSRLCINGKEQAFGRYYWETYAPIAAWSTIRLLLYLSTIMNLSTRQVDYSSAFPQADLDIPVYMRAPQGWFINNNGQLQQHVNPKFHDHTHYLKLKKNLYGCKQAARNWFKLLSARICKEGFVQSKTDSCLFLRSNCIIVIYVDDCLFFFPCAAIIDTIIKSLSTTFK